MRIKSELILDYLIKKDMTQTEFCKRCGLANHTFNHILNGGVRETGVFKLYRVAHAMGVKMDDLVER